MFWGFCGYKGLCGIRSQNIRMLRIQFRSSQEPCSDGSVSSLEKFFFVGLGLGLSGPQSVEKGFKMLLEYTYKGNYIRGIRPKPAVRWSGLLLQSRTPLDYVEVEGFGLGGLGFI